MSERIKIVYAVSDRGGNKFWSRIGTGFENEDGSITVKLDAVPLTGELQILDYAAEVPS